MIWPRSCRYPDRPYQDGRLGIPYRLFYSVNVTEGSIDQAIEVNQRGNYTFAVQNNSSETVKVSGFVNY